MKITVQCAANLTRRPGGPCPKNGTHEYGGHRLCAQHYDSAHWEALGRKERAIRDVALRLAALLDAYWFDGRKLGGLVLAAAEAACVERARLAALPSERWAFGGEP